MVAVKLAQPSAPAQQVDDALDGKSPKQAARSKVGRQEVADWLKYLENGAARRAQSQGHPAYDFGWMWEALKVTDLRH